jgi:class 3 adenylate cyclase
MFIDMKGFTPLTEKLGPEETFSLMDQVFEQNLKKAEGMFRYMGMDYWLGKAQETLARL